LVNDTNVDFLPKAEIPTPLQPDPTLMEQNEGEQSTTESEGENEDLNLEESRQESDTLEDIEKLLVPHREPQQTHTLRD
jgi:hypothetical protein